MKTSALGLIETYGLVGAIEGLDVALKSANVSLIGREYVKGGRVTIELTGDVSAVKAAVEAAAVAVDELGTLISVHVIPRAYDEVWEMLQGRNKQTKDKAKVVDFKQTKEEVKELNTKDKITKEEKVTDEKEIKNTSSTNTKEEKIKSTKDETKQNTKDEVKDKTRQNIKIEAEKDIKETDKKEAEIQGEKLEAKTKEELQSMKVQELRTLARAIELTSLTKKQIKFSKKDQLIDAILDYWKRR